MHLKQAVELPNQMHAGLLRGLDGAALAVNAVLRIDLQLHASIGSILIWHIPEIYSATLIHWPLIKGQGSWGCQETRKLLQGKSDPRVRRRWVKRPPMAHALGNTELLSHSRHRCVDAFLVVICLWKSVLLCIWVNIMMILLVPFLFHQHLHVTEVEHISLTLYLSAMSPGLVFDFQMGRLVVLVVHPTSSRDPFRLELTQSRCWLNLLVKSHWTVWNGVKQR